MWAKIRKAVQYCSDHPIISKVVVGVAVAAIASAVFWWAVLAAVLWVWHSLVCPVPVPVWLLGLMIVGNVAAAVWLIISLRSSLKRPANAKIKTSRLDGIDWTWDWSTRDYTTMINLEGFCPRDETPLVWRGFWDDGEFRCDTCGKVLATYHMDEPETIQAIERRIRGMIARGELKAAAKAT